MKTKFFAAMVLAAGSMFGATRFSVGVNVGGGYGPGYYAPAPVYAPQPVYPDAAYVDAAPGPGYTWVDGYWSTPGYGPRVWTNGFWRAPVARFNYGYAPRYDRDVRRFDRDRDDRRFGRERDGRFERGFRR